MCIRDRSPNSGLIGWVRNCDTMHALIREYRESRRIPLNAEHKIMQNVAPNYDQMMVIQKVEVFEDALDRTSGDDLHKVRGSFFFSLHSRNCACACALFDPLCDCLFACVVCSRRAGLAQPLRYAELNVVLF